MRARRSRADVVFGVFEVLAIFVIVVIGWIVGKLRWLSPEDRRHPAAAAESGMASAAPHGKVPTPSKTAWAFGSTAPTATSTAMPAAPGPGASDEPPRSDPARVLPDAAYYIFVPALLFRTTARIAFRTMPWRTLIAVFVPLTAMLFGVYLFQRHARGRDHGRHSALDAGHRDDRTALAGGIGVARVTRGPLKLATSSLAPALRYPCRRPPPQPACVPRPSLPICPYLFRALFPEPL